ncbi:50S ribosomal protein L21 [Candidatus Bipolaricaulota bacterium]|jgi:large subunit ribosomal protein L21|nr:50S ribosomal protein L21 [Candidatus Bipolaricaulota bacterium]TFH09001.1 MAG: 50S ribosomal protein L21 [Candidatus Atribacteria bacterium]
MYAVIETGGKQYRVHDGMVFDHELLQGTDVGEVVQFDKVLMISSDEDIKIGTPYVEGAVVKGEIQEQGRGKKIIVYKYKSKKGYRRKRGHRQSFMATKITGIEV